MTVRFGLLGAGRIGKVHARAVGANPKAKLVAVADAVEKAATEISSAYGAQVRSIEAIEQAVRHRRRHHLHPDRHPCRPDRAFCSRRQGDLLREADRPRCRARRRMPDRGREGRAHADGRLQPALRSALRRRAQGDRRRRHRRRRDGHDHLARSRPAAARLYRAVRRHFPRHDHPRFRHGALPAGRGAGGGQRPCLGAGRQEDRRGRRLRQRQRHPGNRIRQAVP